MAAQAYLVLGSTFGALGVAAGALGAHALASRLAAQQLATFETAVRYQLFHAVALVLVGFVLAAGPSRAAQVAGFAFVLGILLFSGGIYGWLFTGIRPLVHIVPVGGVSLIVGWVALAVAGWHYLPAAK